MTCPLNRCTHHGPGGCFDPGARRPETAAALAALVLSTPADIRARQAQVREANAARSSSRAS